MTDPANPPAEPHDLIERLMTRITQTYKEGGEWCSLEKAHTLATLVIGLRPQRICEIGVWMGGSLVPMLMALQTLEAVELKLHGKATKRRAIAIDAWASKDSIDGQVGDDRSWWGKVDHDSALGAFLHRLDDHDLRRLCDVVRAPSDHAEVSEPIDLLHIDGNHGEQAIRDVRRFAKHVPPGGVLVLDDLHWAGGHVAHARDLAENLGFKSLYPLGTGVVMLRVHS